VWARDHRPILTTLEKCPAVFAERLHQGQDALLPSFDVDAALASYGAALQQLTPREPA
jgi:[NiFe] hydrogenase diaphorase moiety large subunit